MSLAIDKTLNDDSARRGRTMKRILWTLTQAVIGAAIWGGPFIYYFWSMKP